MSELLIVDDERTVRTAYRKLFEGEGYAVRTAKGGAEAVAMVSVQRPDLVLLDVDMPGMNGFATCKSLRAVDPLLPVIFLTAMEADTDQLRGLSLGADDYVFKTASAQVVLARVAGALERREAYRVSRNAEDCRIVTLGHITVDLDTFAVSCREKRVARLTKSEVDVLRALNAERGKLLSVEEIIASIYGKGHLIDPSSIRKYLASLRNKLREAGELIVTERDKGYRLVR